VFFEIIPPELDLKVENIGKAKGLRGEGSLESLLVFVSRLAWVAGDRIQRLPIKDQLELWSNFSIVDYDEEGE
jgi:hypothetical protein